MSEPLYICDHAGKVDRDCTGCAHGRPHTRLRTTMNGGPCYVGESGLCLIGKWKTVAVSCVPVKETRDDG